MSPKFILLGVVFCLLFFSQYVDGVEIKLPYTPNFKPFFQNDSKDSKDLPKKPKLSNFDLAILEVCGDWGSKPDKNHLARILDDNAYQDEVKKIYQYLEREIIESPQDSEEEQFQNFKKELLDIWFHKHGFSHIFCAHPKDEHLEGMNFFGRYIEAQEEGWAGLEREKCTIKVEPPLYSIGVNYKIGRVKKVKVGEFEREIANYKFGQDCLKTLDISMHADKIIIEATKAYKKAMKNPHNIKSNQDFMCIHKVEDNNTNEVVFVSKEGGIVAFYPTLNSNVCEEINAKGDVLQRENCNC